LINPGFSTFVFNYSLGTGIELKEFKILQLNADSELIQNSYARFSDLTLKSFK